MPADILRQIGTIARSLDSLSNLEFKQIALTKGQYLYVVRIFENPGIIQERLAELLCVDTATCSRALRNLVQKGLLEKKPDATNRKIKHLVLTPAGKRLYPLLKRENWHSTQVALTGLSAAETAQLRQLLAKVSHNVIQDWQAVKKGHQRHY